MLYHWTFHHEGRHLGHQSTIPLPQRNHSDIVPRHLSEIQTYNVIYFSVCRRGKYICRPSKFQVTYRVGNDKGNISRNIWARCEFGSYQTPLQQQPDILPNISLPTSLNHRYWVWKRGAEAAKKGKNAKKILERNFSAGILFGDLLCLNLRIPGNKCGHNLREMNHIPCFYFFKSSSTGALYNMDH